MTLSTRLVTGFLLVWAATSAGCTASPTAPVATQSLTGAWLGSAADSSQTLGAGSMMGQASMGAMTWQLTQNGTAVTGSMTFAGSGMQGRMPGTLTGTLSGDILTFTIDMPMGSMHNVLSVTCSSRATGTALINRATMTMTGTYSGAHSCHGPFNNGQMLMTHR
jgi:hypothetical protein